MVKDPRSRLGWNVQAFFSDWSTPKRFRTSKKIQTFFGGIGTIHVREDKATYVVGSLKHILQVIIPHFKLPFN